MVWMVRVMIRTWKMFTFAKEKLLSLSQGEEPFHLTMLTVDTHFEDGYVCESCTEEFGDNQYANVIAVSAAVNRKCRREFVCCHDKRRGMRCECGRPEFCRI